MTDQITIHSKFAPETVVFGDLGKTSKGGKIVFLSFPGNKRIKVQTPEMSAPFGVSSFADATSGTSSYSLDASFRGFDTDTKQGRFLAAFLDKVKSFDDVVLDKATANSKAWLGKAMDKTLTAEFYRTSVRYPADPKYAPTLRLKLSPQTEYYDEKGNQVAMDYITKGCTFRAIVEISSVYFVGKNFGVSWRISQVAAVTRPDKLAGFAFQAEDDEGGDDA
jgi:hypothetical protein